MAGPGTAEAGAMVAEDVLDLDRGARGTGAAGSCEPFQRALDPRQGGTGDLAPRAVREIAWKAQTRLCGRFRTLARKGKRSTIIATAIARELSAFIWAINREVAG